MRAVVHTNHPVAIHSPDHQDAEHGGSGNDNSRNPNFNRKLRELFGRPPSVLDLGCAGGGFVKSLLDEGHLAVGLEGSDYCKNRRKFEWATVPDNLFTCDVTKPFRIEADPGEDDPLQRVLPYQAVFDVVTCWEVMEHFSEPELPQVIDNVLNHLAPAGLWVMSVSEQVDGKFHRCVRPIGWWRELFARHGLASRTDLRSYFEPDWVRGPIPTPWAITADGSFHLVLQRKPA